MSSRMPPVPPENRANEHDEARADARNAHAQGRNTKPEQQGQQANTKQNTTHQGMQQDR